MTKNNKTGLLLRLLGAAALLLSMAAARAAPLDDMRRLVEGGQFEPAYKLALQNPQLIGDVHFDFLYGVAAVNVGRVPEGILALERHLAAIPANDRARLELARGYFLIGEFGRAKSEFEFVLRYNPPAGVKANIASYLQAMELRDARNRGGSARLYAEIGAGHDSNVNVGTYRDELQFAFGTIKLAGTTSQAVADDFVQVAMGGQQTMRVSNRLSMFAGLDLDHKRNADARDFDLTNAAANVGFSVVSGPGLYRGTLSVGALQVGGNAYRETLALVAEANYTLGPDTGLQLAAQYNEFRHHDADKARDARATTFVATLSQNVPQWWGAPSFGLRLGWTQEDNLTGRDDLGRRVPLLRVFGGVTPAERWRVTAALTAIHQRFMGEDIGFGSVRSDNTYSVDLAASYAVAPRWTVRAEYLAYLNRSNQDLYDARRQMLAIKTRYQY
jgi:hypothetical protein